MLETYILPWFNSPCFLQKLVSVACVVSKEILTKYSQVVCESVRERRARFNFRSSVLFFRFAHEAPSMNSQNRWTKLSKVGRAIQKLATWSCYFFSAHAEINSCLTCMQVQRASQQRRGRGNVRRVRETATERQGGAAAERIPGGGGRAGSAAGPAPHWLSCPIRPPPCMFLATNGEASVLFCFCMAGYFAVVADLQKRCISWESRARAFRNKAPVKVLLWKFEMFARMLHSWTWSCKGNRRKKRFVCVCAGCFLLIIFGNTFASFPWMAFRSSHICGLRCEECPKTLPVLLKQRTGTQRDLYTQRKQIVWMQQRTWTSVVRMPWYLLDSPCLFMKGREKTSMCRCSVGLWFFVCGLRRLLNCFRLLKFLSDRNCEPPEQIRHPGGKNFLNCTFLVNLLNLLGLVEFVLVKDSAQLGVCQFELLGFVRVKISYFWGQKFSLLYCTKWVIFQKV